MVYIDNVLAVDTKKRSRVKFLFQLRQRNMFLILFAICCYYLNLVIVSLKTADFIRI